MNNLKFFLIVFLCVLTIPNLSIAATLHVIEITDTDRMIGSTRDKILISNLVDEIGRIANMTVNKQMFDKNDNSYLSAIQRLNPSADDVVWIYYSGHGRNSGDGWPQFTNSGNKYKLTSIKNLLESKNARLNLIMYDCCNHGATTSPIPSSRLLPTALDILFRNAKGTIIASGAEAGKYGHGSPQIGGFFTVSFIQALNEVSPADGNDLWKVVFRKTKEKTNQMCQTARRPMQNPIYKISVRNDGSCDVPSVIAPEEEDTDAIDPFPTSSKN